MNKLFFVFVLIFTITVQFLFSQNTKTSDIQKAELDTVIYTWIEDEATYPGGFDLLAKFIKDQIVYPQAAIDQGIEGVVYLKMVIEKDGSVSNVQIIRGVSPELDKEALRVVSLMPKWNPALHRKIPVRSYYQLPIKFLLSDINAQKVVKQPKNDEVLSDYNIPQEEKQEQDGIFIFVESPASFPGGEEARMKFMKDNLIYPKEALRKGEQGIVIVKFVVEKDGSVTNVQILRGVSPSLDAEAMRVVKMMPKWIPATQRKKQVRVWYNMPVKFSLDKGKTNKNKNLKKTKS